MQVVDNMKYILYMILIFLFFFFNILDSKDIKEESIDKSKYFITSDKLDVLFILKKYEKNCLDMKSFNQNLLTSNYIDKFEIFPCKGFNLMLKQKIKPLFILDKEYNKTVLDVTYNYYTVFEEGDELYRSERTLILYLIKDENNTILLDSLGLAG